ncbi:jg16168 [Pararge aegeria aegeria]|uniref:Jg16168 protein n=1 Tax=Pararge aegeria aegeria TaxID=348720 RepID=A0A8S4RD05_9NEOP|nr:jg16168 [Pararge aegeria aegeria]
MIEDDLWRRVLGKVRKTKTVFSFSNKRSSDECLVAMQDNGFWRIRYNRELYELFKEPNVVKSIKLLRMQWAGQVQRMGGHGNESAKGVDGGHLGGA